MNTGFEVVSVDAQFFYGDIAGDLLEDLALRYQQEIGGKVHHWAYWILSNGCSIPVPSQIGAEVVPVSRAIRLFRMSFDKVVSIRMHGMSETDRFMAQTTVELLNDSTEFVIA